MCGYGLGVVRPTKLGLKMFGETTFINVALDIAVRLIAAISNLNRVCVTLIKTTRTNPHAVFFGIAESSGGIYGIFPLEIFLGKGASN